MNGYGRILLPTDFSRPSRRGVARGAELARSGNSKVMLLFVVEKNFFAPLSMTHQAPVTFGGEGDLLGEAVVDGGKRLKSLAEEFFGEMPVETKVNVAASATAGILDIAETFRPDVIVMAAHGRSGIERLLLGSTTEKVIRHATCEVLVVREPV